MAKRKSLSNKVRFEIFKRDMFTCQYCGSKSPDVILNVDHINPVSNGGGNNVENLTTSCWGCNSGKKDIKLSDSAAIEKSRAQIEESQEKIEQIKMLSDWASGMADSINEEFNAFNDFVYKITGSRFMDETKIKITNLVKKYGLKHVMDGVLSAIDYAGEDNLSVKHLSNACKLLLIPESLSNARYCRGIYSNRFGTNRRSFKLIEEQAESLIIELGYDVVLEWFKNEDQNELRRLMGLEVF